MASYKYKHGLAIMRAQPFHIGHERLVNQMLDECAHVTIALGSIQEKGTKRNPFDYNTRKKMIENIYQSTKSYSRMTIIGLADINEPQKWGSFVIKFLKENLPDLPYPDAYYAGAKYDSNWFNRIIENICLVDRTDKNFPLVTATMVREMLKLGDPHWKDFVAPVNHQLIEEYLKKIKI